MHCTFENQGDLILPWAWWYSSKDELDAISGFICEHMISLFVFTEKGEKVMDGKCNSK